jgi:D-alanyl-lipoteichoic acid acyltransferase DltB (MBOAT superfamily)
MLFQSQVFILIFLPAALALYYAVAGSAAARQWVLIGASLFFYGWWDARFVPLLVGQVTVTWLLALLHVRLAARWPLVLGVVLNLASLATFKYVEFLILNIEAVTGLSLPRTGIVLPIGISFFSFQLISYLVDRMRGDAPIYPYRPFALFVMVFPHLIAGPIVRHNELIPQFTLDPRRDGLAQRFGIGFIIFTVGFAKKVLLADKLAPIVDTLFVRAGQSAVTFAEGLNAALAFTFQLFLDFSAYTEMAIGIALMFGLLLPENFRRPYLATSLRDFWRRWHISLSNFLRDYLYIPLGGSRSGPARFVVATLVTMFLCGLWHGAGWNFIIWGLWHGVGLLVCHAWQRLGRPMPVPLGWLVTMLFVIVGWVMFRALDFDTARNILTAMASPGSPGGGFTGGGLIVASALVSALVPSAHEIRERLENMTPQPWFAAAAASLSVYCILEVGRGAPVNFIYFQF